MCETGDLHSKESPPSSRRNLPVELVHCIIAEIDDLEEDSRFPALAACTLVCQAWSSICRSRLFRTLSINHLNFTSHLSFLHFTAPHLCEYVRDFHLSWYCLGRHPTLEWTAACFGRLENLNALHIAGIGGEWPKLPTPFALGITTLLATPHLRGLEITDWDFGEDAHGLLYMLSFCSTSLQTLSLRGIRLQRDVKVHTLAVINMEALSTLRLEDVHYQGLRVAFVTCPNLRSLTAVIRRGETWTLPSYVPSKLEEIHLHVWPLIPPVPCFGETVRLSVLTIHMQTSRHAASTDFSRSNNWVKDCINHLPFPKLLDRFTLHIRSNLSYPKYKYPQPTDFEDLSTFLARLRDSGMLRHINITVLITMLQYTGFVLDASNASEMRKLREGFAPILGPGVNVQLTIRQTSGEGYEDLDWMIFGEEGDLFSR